MKKRKIRGNHSYFRTGLYVAGRTQARDAWIASACHLNWALKPINSSENRLKSTIYQQIEETWTFYVRHLERPGIGRGNEVNIVQIPDKI